MNSLIDRFKLPEAISSRLKKVAAVSPNQSVWAALLSPGRMTVTFLLLAVMSGVLLAVKFQPLTAQQAQRNFRVLMDGLGIFMLLHHLHRWAAFLLIGSIALHLIGLWKEELIRLPMGANWALGVGLLGLALLLTTTGFLLPWDVKSLALAKLGVVGLTGVEAVDNGLVKLLFGEVDSGVISLGTPRLLHFVVLPLLLVVGSLTHRVISIQQRDERSDKGSAKPPTNRWIALLRLVMALAALSLLALISANHEVREATAITLVPSPDWLWLMNIFPSWLAAGAPRWLLAAALPLLILLVLALKPALAPGSPASWLIAFLVGIAMLALIISFGGSMALARSIPYQGCQVCHRPTMVGLASTEPAILDSGDPKWLRFHLTAPIRSILEPKE